MGSQTIELAHRMRRGELPTRPTQLYTSALEEVDEGYEALELYRHAMLHAGALEEALGPFESCPRCGERFREEPPKRPFPNS